MQVKQVLFRMITRALIVMDESVKPLKDAGLVTRDSRMKESKYGLKES